MQYAYLCTAAGERLTGVTSFPLRPKLNPLLLSDFQCNRSHLVSAYLTGGSLLLSPRASSTEMAITGGLPARPSSWCQHRVSARVEASGH